MRSCQFSEDVWITNNLKTKIGTKYFAEMLFDTGSSLMGFCQTFSVEEKVSIHENDTIPTSVN